MFEFLSFYCNWLTLLTNLSTEANSENAPIGTVLSGSTLFAKKASDDKTDGNYCDWCIKC